MSSLRNNQAGLTLIEVVVAMLVLTVGVLGLAAGTGWVLRSTEVARVDGARAVATQSAIEQVRALPYDDLGQARTSELTGGFSASWSRRTLNPSGQSSEMEIVVVGPGRTGQVAGPGAQLASNVADTVVIWVTRP